MIPWSWAYDTGVACLRCLDARWVAVLEGLIPCPDCQTGAAVLALKRGHRR